MAEVVATGDDGAARSAPAAQRTDQASPGLMLAEAQALLGGCGLPAAWCGQPQWRILAAGSGWGLQFLAAWQAWRADAHRPRLLHFTAVAPTAPEIGDLLRAAAAQPVLSPLAQALAAQWLGLLPGVHRLAFEQARVLLTLCIGPAEPMLRQLDCAADSIVLDEDASLPPQLLATLPRTLARLCRRGTRLAAAAPLPWPALRACGFAAQPAPAPPATSTAAAAQPAPPPAPALLLARWEPAWTVRRAPAPPAKPSHAVVVGAGLAGAAAAASLARRGWTVQVLDAGPRPASGASGLPAGLLAPHQSPDDNLLSRLSRAGIRITLQEARERLVAGRDWDAVGVLESRGADGRPPPALGEPLAPWTRVASAQQATQAGLPDGTAAWWHALAAWVRPAALVEAWLATPGISFAGGCRVHDLVREGEAWAVRDPGVAVLARAPLVVVAAALGSASLLPGLALHAVRGQVSWQAHGDEPLPLPPGPVNGQGHLLPRVWVDGRPAWLTGSTYHRGETDAVPRPQDQWDNLQRLSQLLPGLGAALTPAFTAGTVQAWAGVRCTSADRRPLVGEAAPGLWLLAALGSRGLTFAALCAELVAARLHHEPLPLEARLAQALDLARSQGRRPITG